MKKNKINSLATYLLILFISFQSCTNSTDEINQNLELLNTTLKTIDKNESPELSNNQIEQLGFQNVAYDYSRITILDKENSTLKVPFDLKKSKKLLEENNARGGNRSVGICIKITIARTNPNNSGSCQGGCFECIGFRCDFVTFPCLIERNNDGSNEELSRDREQIAEVIVNEDEGVIEYNFYNNIDWEYLENN